MTVLYRLYADLNCPFCYAQNERLHDLRSQAMVQWRGVRHAPAIPIPPATPSPAEQQELDHEVARVREREPLLSIVTPVIRPNSELATFLIAAATRVDPERAVLLRTLLYRALWLRSQDISNARVLASLQEAAGLPQLAVTPKDRELADSWQSEWEGGPFDRRIPSLQSPAGAVLLGLSERRRVQVFLKSGMLSSQGDDSC
jgi:predicted DsbA family dithiol-disulfide isomerase